MNEYVVMRIVLVALFATTVLSGLAYFVLGEKLLREVRDRFPLAWGGAGSPTFLSFAAWGAGYWRPVSAGNFFTFKRYASLDDAALAGRCARVRLLQFLSYGASIALFVMGFVITKIEG
ncbi:MAG: hypothetical protein ABJD07_04335 [Gemmatimonadaceae bacterium]